MKSRWSRIGQISAQLLSDFLVRKGLFARLYFHEHETLPRREFIESLSVAQGERISLRGFLST